jgi:ribosomal-protein-alanine N-acetyltransferase
LCHRALSIRRASKRDLEEIYRLHTKSSRELSGESLEWFKALLSSRSRRIVLIVAELDGVVGYLLAYKAGDRGYIESIAVDEGFRGRGIGTALLREAEMSLRARGVREVYLSVKDWNTGAISFYLKHSYAVKNVVLWLSASPLDLSTSLSSDEYVVADVSASAVKPRLRHYAIAWSSLVDSVDVHLYKKAPNYERAILIKRGKRVVAYALYSVERSLVVDSISLSSYNQLEAVRALVLALKHIALSRGVDNIVVPVDASKQRLVELLVNSGFRVEESELLLYKELE